MAPGLVRRREVRILAAGLVIAAIIVGVGFGVFGGGGSGTDGDATPTIVLATPTRSPEPQPTIVGNQLNYPAHGYAAVIPDGWHANPGGIVAGLTKIDTFFSAPPPIDGVQANVSVTCEGDPAGISTDDFVTNHLATLAKRSAIDLKRLDPVVVDGQRTELASYTITREEITVRQYDAMFVTPSCAWTIALATSASREDESKAIFFQFLQSFRLIASATPTSTPSA